MSSEKITDTAVLLVKALDKFGFCGCETEFIRHNENLTYRVHSADGDFLLRIHRHRDGFTDGGSYDGLDRAAIYETELEFINHLRSCGMTLQTPKKSVSGKYVARLEDGTCVSCLGWLEGHIIDKNELSVGLCRELGVMCARLHECSRSFSKTAALRYDGALCRKLKGNLRGFECEGGLDCDGIITAALDFMAGRYDRTENEFLLVHSDLSFSNVLVTDGGLVPIDFSLFGYSHPMTDIADLFCYIDDAELRGAIIDGYESGGGVIARDMLECGFAMSILLGINLHKNLWINEDWFKKRLAVWCERYFLPLSTGEHIC